VQLMQQQTAQRSGLRLGLGVERERQQGEQRGEEQESGAHGVSFSLLSAVMIDGQRQFR